MPSSAIGLFEIGISPIGVSPPIFNLYPGEAPFPPGSPQSLQNAIPSYLYDQFNDDDDLAAFVTAYNVLTQIYVTWFNTIQLPIYTGLYESLLDWVGQGLYGVARPTLYSGVASDQGLIAEDEIAQFEIAEYDIVNNITDVTVTNDDIYKRIITWYAYKGDGKQFSAQWLRRRVARFLYGPNGTDYTEPTQNISLIFGGGNLSITIISGITYSSGGLIAQDEIGMLEIGEVDFSTDPVAVPPVAPIFVEAVNSGALETPEKFIVTAKIANIGI